MLRNYIFQTIMETKIWIKYLKIILYVEVLRLSRRHHKLEFQVEKKQEQRKFSLSNFEQDKKKVKSAGKKEKMAHRK